MYLYNNNNRLYRLLWWKGNNFLFCLFCLCTAADVDSSSKYLSWWWWWLKFGKKKFLFWKTSFLFGKFLFFFGEIFFQDKNSCRAAGNSNCCCCFIWINFPEHHCGWPKTQTCWTCFYSSSSSSSLKWFLCPDFFFIDYRLFYKTSNLIHSSHPRFMEGNRSNLQKKIDFFFSHILCLINII